MPVLARTLESCGLATILVTTMPYWVEKIGTPRTLAAAFPFGHTIGYPGDAAQQRRVIIEALAVLEAAESPGTIIHSTETWPQGTKEAIKSWQPEEPSPIIDELAPKFKEMLRQRRRSRT